MAREYTRSLLNNFIRFDDSFYYGEINKNLKSEIDKLPQGTGCTLIQKPFNITNNDNCVISSTQRCVTDYDKLLNTVTTEFMKTFVNLSEDQKLYILSDWKNDWSFQQIEQELKKKIASNCNAENKYNTPNTIKECHNVNVYNFNTGTDQGNCAVRYVQNSIINAETAVRTKQQAESKLNTANIFGNITEIFQKITFFISGSFSILISCIVLIIILIIVLVKNPNYFDSIF